MDEIKALAALFKLEDDRGSSTYHIGPIDITWTKARPNDPPTAWHYSMTFGSHTVATSLADLIPSSSFNGTWAAYLDIDSWDSLLPTQIACDIYRTAMKKALDMPPTITSGDRFASFIATLAARKETGYTLDERPLLRIEWTEDANDRDPKHWAYVVRYDEWVSNPLFYDALLPECRYELSWTNAMTCRWIPGGMCEPGMRYRALMKEILRPADAQPAAQPTTRPPTQPPAHPPTRQPAQSSHLQAGPCGPECAPPSA